MRAGGPTSCLSLCCVPASARWNRDATSAWGADSLISREGGGGKNAGVGYYFVNAGTGAYLTNVGFVPWEDPDRSGWKHSVFTPVYNDERDLIAFRLNSPKHVENLAVTSLDGSFFEVYGASASHIDSFPK